MFVAGKIDPVTRASRQKFVLQQSKKFKLQTLVTIFSAVFDTIRQLNGSPHGPYGRQGSTEKALRHTI